MNVYIILPSTVNSTVHRNTRSDYVTSLARPIQGQNLEVCLMSVSVKKSWPNITRQNNVFYISSLPEGNIATETNDVYFPEVDMDRKELIFTMTNGQVVRVAMKEFRISRGHYGREEEIVNAMTRMMEKLPKNDIEIKVSNEPRGINIKVSKGNALILPKNGLSKVLGFQEEIFTPGEYNNQYPTFSLTNQQFIHISLEGLTRPVIFGNLGRRSVLETIPTDGEYEQTIHFNFKNPTYHQVLKHRIDRIQVKLYDSDFVPVDIQSGETVVLLHFKESK